MKSEYIKSFDNIDYNELMKKVTKCTGFTVDYFFEYKVLDLKHEIENDTDLKKYDNLKILDFGCGTGLSDFYILKHLSYSSPNTYRKCEIYGIDISGRQIQKATSQNLENVHYEVSDIGGTIPFHKKFDVIFIANVMRHIPRENHEEQIKILKESLNHNGIIMMYEFNPFNPVAMYYYYRYDTQYDNMNVKIMSPMYSKKLFENAGFNNINIKYRFFIPGFLKNIVFIEQYLKKIPLGANYYLLVKNN